MPTISGYLQDVTTHPTAAREVLVRAAHLRAGSATITTAETRSIPVSGSGEVSFECEPGPAVMLIQFTNGAPTQVPLLVGAESSALGDAADAAAIADEIDRGRLEELARELVALAHEVRSDRNDVAGWHPQIEGWHEDVEGWQAQVAEDRQTAHDAAGVAVDAAERSEPIKGEGSPEGVYDAPVGRLYVDITSGVLWHKATPLGSSNGWAQLDTGDGAVLAASNWAEQANDAADRAETAYSGRALKESPPGSGLFSFTPSIFYESPPGSGLYIYEEAL